VSSGDAVEVALTPGHLHVFDAQTEQNVRAGAPAGRPARAPAAVLSDSV
jgi:hypothetical protein